MTARRSDGKGDGDGVSGTGDSSSWARGHSAPRRRRERCAELAMLHRVHDLPTRPQQRGLSGLAAGMAYRHLKDSGVHRTTSGGVGGVGQFWGKILPSSKLPKNVYFWGSSPPPVQAPVERKKKIESWHTRVARPWEPWKRLACGKEKK